MEFNNSDEAVAVIVPKLLYFINITSVQDVSVLNFDEG